MRLAVLLTAILICLLVSGLLIAALRTPRQGEGEGEVASAVLRKAKEAVQRIVTATDASLTSLEVRFLEGKEGRLVVEELRTALAVAEPNSPQGLPLAFLLAFHGDREGFRWLIARLEQDRERVWLALRRAARANPDAGHEDVDPTRWRAWLARQSDNSLRQGLFRELTSALLMEDHARDEYLAGLRALSERRRSEARQILERFRLTHPEHALAEEATELADLLGQMSEEKRPDSACQSHQIAIYELRDLHCEIISEPANRVRVLDPIVPVVANPAQQLVRLGRRDLRVLRELLLDRRPTSTIAYGRCKDSRYTVLRNQDVAIEVIEAVLDFRVYLPMQSARYLSGESPDEWRRCADLVRRWEILTQGGSAEHRLVVSVRLAGVRDALRMIRTLAKDFGRTEEAISECRRLYMGRRTWRPEICEVMCELGDFSLLENTLATAPAGEPQSCEVWHIDQEDGARFVNARETADRLRAKYAGSGR